MITHMNEFNLRAMSLADADTVVTLYRAVAAGPDSGLARRVDEISREYVAGFLARALIGGVALGAFAGEQLVGEIHATRIGPRQFCHVLTELTIAVHPDVQGRGIGSRLFDALFDSAAKLVPGATRIELVARSGNTAAQRLYEKLGFRAEGRFLGRVRLPDGQIEDDIPMARLL